MTIVTDAKLSERDLDVLGSLGRMRFLSVPQVAALHFPSADAALRRLRELRARKLLTEAYVPVRPYDRRAKSVFALSALGARALARARDGPAPRHVPEHERRSGLFLDHTLARNALYVVLELLHRDAAFQLLAWRHGPDGVRSSARVRLDGRTVRVPLIPDAFVALREGSSVQGLVVEIDMGTVAPERMRLRYAGYFRWWKGRGHVARFGNMPVRVLTVTTTPSRLERLRAAAAGGAGEGHTRLFWFSLLEEVDLGNPHRLLGRVWRTSDQREPGPRHLLTSPPPVCAFPATAVTGPTGSAPGGPSAACAAASSTDRTSPSPGTPAATGA